jgi:uncharacterized Zn-finger protein
MTPKKMQHLLIITPLVLMVLLIKKKDLSASLKIVIRVSNKNIDLSCIRSFILYEFNKCF